MLFCSAGRGAGAAWLVATSCVIRGQALRSNAIGYALNWEEPCYATDTSDFQLLS
jgi:hypothetical protein